MHHSEFQMIFEDQVQNCREVLVKKAAEYAGDGDRLHNFAVAGALQQVAPRVALGGMMAKHIVSVFDLIQRDTVGPIEVWNEKIGDALNYLFLLKAAVIEELNFEPLPAITTEANPSNH